MFKKALIATDFSASSFSVVKNPAPLLALGVEECLVLQCLNFVQTETAGLYYTYAVLEENLKNQVEYLHRAGIRAESRIVPGFARSEVNRIAEEEDCDLICAGVQTSSLVNEAIVGDIGYEILHGCRKPLLLLRLGKGKSGAEEASPIQENLLKHVLYPTDFSQTANAAFDVVYTLVSRGVEKVTVMHVQDQTHLDPYLLARLDEFNTIDKARLTTILGQLPEDPTLLSDSILTFGNPAKEILSAVRERGISLVVMGSLGRGYVSELFLGSVSHNVARHAESSVLLVPPPALS